MGYGLVFPAALPAVFVAFTRGREPMRPRRPEVPMARPNFAVFVCAATLAAVVGGCHDDDDHTHTSTYPSCTAIIDACHPVDVGTGAFHDCHELAHNATKEEDCAPKKTSCLALCAASSDGGTASDAAHGHD